MKILGMEKVSFVDYEGKICTTIFTGGCNYKCPFCHNSGIVKQEYKEITENEVIEHLLSRKKMIDALTISGGEPTLQPDLENFVRKIKDLGFLVKLDTNGTNPEVLKNLLDKNLLDYVAMDVKNNFDSYNQICGTHLTQIENVKKSLDLLKNSEIDYELRTTLVNNFHKKENIEKLAKDIAGHKKLFLQKFVESDTCFDKNLEEVPLLDAQEFQKILEKEISAVKLRGY